MAYINGKKVISKVIERGEGGITIPQVTNITLNDTILFWVAPNYEELEVSKTSYLVSVNSTELETEETSLNVADYLIDGNNTISVIVKATLSREGESATEIVEYSKPQLLDVITKMGATLTTALGYSSAVVINDKVYLFIKGNPQCYDPTSDTITTMGATIKYTGTSAVNINNKAYIFGGNLNGTRKNPIECYDPTSDTITTMSATLTTALTGTSAVNINNKAYIFGGYDGSRYNTIECYDPSNDTITTMSATLVEKTAGTCAVTINNKAYIFGGNDKRIIQRYE